MYSRNSKGTNVSEPDRAREECGGKEQKGNGGGKVLLSFIDHRQDF